MAQSKTVRTRVLILSDTHGKNITSDQLPSLEADVAIHCGDMTNESKISEFQTTINLMRRLNAPLKLVIPGNHDFTMDSAAFATKAKEASDIAELSLIEEVYGAPGEAAELFETARMDDIVLLNEGTCYFKLKNGAFLTVFASPYTPALGTWGFQYHLDKGRVFPIRRGTDIVITHGPPKGILDRTNEPARAGCPNLFESVAKVRPPLHCFGHIHEAWGARLVKWKGHIGEQAPALSHFTAIDNERSYTVENLASLDPSTSNSSQETQERKDQLKKYEEDRCCKATNCLEGDLNFEQQTLFVNASISDTEKNPSQKPWLVDIDLIRWIER